MRTSLIITTYEWPEALELALRSVARQTRLPDEVIIADDGSGPSTARLVSDWGKRLPWNLIHVWQRNEGFRAARIRNLATAASRGDYVIFVDGDMLLHEAFVADHCDLAERGCFVQGSRSDTNAKRASVMLRTGRVGVGPFTSGIRKRHMTLRSVWLSGLASRRAFTIDRVKSCNLAVWRDDLLAVNGFDERFVGWGPEDKDLGARLNHHGVARKYVRFRALATHLHHASRKPQGSNPMDALLAATLANRSVRCQCGLDQHLAAFAAGVPAEFRPVHPI